MSKKHMKYSILTGLLTFALCLTIFLAIDSPSPYIGALVAAFILFEISFYHFFGRERENNKLL